jgi:hypothetical protein
MADSGASQSPQQSTPSANRRWLRVAAIATLILVAGVGLWWGFSFQSKRAAIQRVIAEWKSIDNEFWPKLLEGRRPMTPEAAAQQEAVITRYFGKAKQIDLSGCPPDFCAAFTDYIAAKEQHDRSLHGPAIPGQELQNLIVDIPTAAAKMYELHDRLEAIAKKYWVRL